MIANKEKYQNQSATLKEKYTDVKQDLCEARQTAKFTDMQAASVQVASMNAKGSCIIQ